MSSINHPAHYGGDTTYEAIKVIEAWDLGFCLGNTVKYISRAGKKDPDKEVEDLKKAIWYLNRRLEQLEKPTLVSRPASTMLSHNPEFKLPDSAPAAPEDIIDFLTENYDKLDRITVSKMLGRGEYQKVAQIANRYENEKATIEEFADYCMKCIWHEVSRSRDTTYKLTLCGQKFERSKHITIGDQLPSQPDMELLDLVALQEIVKVALECGESALPPLSNAVPIIERLIQGKIK